jgi:hypothetical protein
MPKRKGTHTLNFDDGSVNRLCRLIDVINKSPEPISAEWITSPNESYALLRSRYGHERIFGTVCNLAYRAGMEEPLEMTTTYHLKA